MELSQSLSKEQLTQLWKDANPNRRSWTDRLEEEGFIAVATPACYRQLLKAAATQAKWLFHLAKDTKSLYQHRDTPSVLGYLNYPGKFDGYFEEDVEMFHCGPFESVIPHPSGLKSFGLKNNLWPEENAIFKKTYGELYQYHSALCELLLAEIILKYKIDDPSFIDEITKGQSLQRAMKYSSQQVTQSVGQIRVQAHRDVSLFTVLTAGTQSELEILTQAGQWHSLDQEGAYCYLGGGGMMEILSHGVLKNMIHRVVMKAESLNAERISTPFFYYPPFDYYLRPIEQFCPEQIQTDRYPSCYVLEYLEKELKVPFVLPAERELVRSYLHRLLRSEGNLISDAHIMR